MTFYVYVSLFLGLLCFPLTHGTEDIQKKIPDSIHDIFSLDKALTENGLTFLKKSLEEGANANETNTEKAPLLAQTLFSLYNYQARQDGNGLLYNKNTQERYYQAIELLLAKGANPNYIFGSEHILGAYQQFALFSILLKYRDKEAITLFLRHGANPNITLSNLEFGQHLPLSTRASVFDRDITTMLLSAGADPNKIEHNKTIFTVISHCYYPDKNTYDHSKLIMGFGKEYELYQKSIVIMLRAQKRKDCILSRVPRRLLLYLLSFHNPLSHETMPNYVKGAPFPYAANLPILKPETLQFRYRGKTSFETHSENHTYYRANKDTQYFPKDCEEYLPKLKELLKPAPAWPSCPIF